MKCSAQIQDLLTRERLTELLNRDVAACEPDEADLEKLHQLSYIRWATVKFGPSGTPGPGRDLRVVLKVMSCDIDIHTHTPAKKSSTNFLLHTFVIRACSTNSLGHRHGHECHSPGEPARQRPREALRAGAQSYTSKGIGRRGIGSFVRNSYVSTPMPCRPPPLGCGSTHPSNRCDSRAIVWFRPGNTKYKAKTRHMPLLVHFGGTPGRDVIYACVYIYIYIYTYIYIYIYMYSILLVHFGGARGPLLPRLARARRGVFEAARPRNRSQHIAVCVYQTTATTTTTTTTTTNNQQPTTNNQQSTTDNQPPTTNSSSSSSSNNNDTNKESRPVLTCAFLLYPLFILS